MSEISRTALFGKLGPVAYRAIESATLFCKMRGNPYVELTHWIHQLLQQSDTDLHRILKHYAVDAAPLARDLTAALDRLPRGASSVSDLAVQVEESVEPAGCQCGEVLKGKVAPAECALFGTLCTPEAPVGACMVSSEGSCAAAYKYGR